MTCCTVTTVSVVALTEEGSVVVDAGGISIAIVVTVIAFVHIGAFSGKQYKSGFAVAGVRAFCVAAFGIVATRGSLSAFVEINTFSGKQSKSFFAVTGVGAIVVVTDSIGAAVIEALFAFVDVSTSVAVADITGFTYAGVRAFCVGTFSIVTASGGISTFVDINTFTGSHYKSGYAGAYKNLSEIYL